MRNPLKREVLVQDPKHLLASLDLHLRVHGHTRLDGSALEGLSGSTAFTPVRHGLVGRLLQGGALGGNSFSGRHGQSVVIISEDWTVSIHSVDFFNCIIAMCALINTITGELGTTLAINVITIPDGDEVTLEGLMAEAGERDARRLRKDRKKDIVLGAVIGAFLSTGLGAVVWLALDWL